jgi:hypothetical protein
VSPWRGFKACCLGDQNRHSRRVKHVHTTDRKCAIFTLCTLIRVGHPSRGRSGLHVVRDDSGRVSDTTQRGTAHRSPDAETSDFPCRHQGIGDFGPAETIGRRFGLPSPAMGSGKAMRIVSPRLPGMHAIRVSSVQDMPELTAAPAMFSLSRTVLLMTGRMPVVKNEASVLARASTMRQAIDSRRRRRDARASPTRWRRPAQTSGPNAVAERIRRWSAGSTRAQRKRPGRCR